MNIYPDLAFPQAPKDRPTLVVNMVSTIDGKILSGERDEHVMDLGSKTDHETMRHIESAVEGVMIGAGSLRATPGLWYRAGLKRFVVTGSGDLDYGTRFFSDDPSLARVVTVPSGITNVPEGIQTIITGPPINWFEVLLAMRHDMGIETLLVEGGSELNASLLALDLIDELFLTLSPKVKLGKEVPTIADGDPLARENLLRFDLMSHHNHESELFLRYRRSR